MDSPSAAQRPYVFVIGSDGNLWLNWWNGSQWGWANQGNPPVPPGQTVIGGVGAITVMDSPSAAKRPYAFVIGSDGHLWLNWWNGSQWGWANQGNPPVPPGQTVIGGVGVVTVLDSPGAIQRPYAFVVGNDDHLLLKPTEVADLGFRWMTVLWSTLSNRPLSRITLPGSHDAAMWSTDHCTHLANRCNTETQAGTIGDQLRWGLRYFDLRPTIWRSRTGDTIFMGHFSSFLGRRVGCLGANLDDVLGQVRDFFASDAFENEIAILAFSHTLDVDDGDPFSVDQWTALVTQVQTGLAGLYLTASQYSNLLVLTPGQVRSANARVITIFAGIPTNMVDPANGVFSYIAPGDLKKIVQGNENLIVYDQFSDTQDFDKMKRTQLEHFEAYFKDPSYPPISLFLYSWTLTKPAGRGVCNDVAARQANSRLRGSVEKYIQDSRFLPGHLPNIMYVDYADPETPLQVCMVMNLL